MTAVVKEIRSPTNNEKAVSQAAVNRAIQFLWQTQRPDGSWDGLCEVGHVWRQRKCW